jgi:terminal uridylyltransferase
MNVAYPPVIPNLQRCSRQYSSRARQEQDLVQGCNVQFWSNREEIVANANANRLTRNRESVSSLLLGFFEYFAFPSQGRGFNWVRETISIRTEGGLLSKQEKGWTGVKTDDTGFRNWNLLAIEDPFEINHNVARTVTYNGMTSIRNEFRRARMIVNRVQQIPGVGWEWRANGGSVGEDFLAEAIERVLP